MSSMNFFIILELDYCSLISCDGDCNLGTYTRSVLEHSVAGSFSKCCGLKWDKKHVSIMLVSVVPFAKFIHNLELREKCVN